MLPLGYPWVHQKKCQSIWSNHLASYSCHKNIYTYMSEELYYKVCVFLKIFEKILVSEDFNAVINQHRI